MGNCSRPGRTGNCEHRKEIQRLLVSGRKAEDAGKCDESNFSLNTRISTCCVVLLMIMKKALVSFLVSEVCMKAFWYGDAWNGEHVLFKFIYYRCYRGFEMSSQWYNVLFWC